LSVLRLCQEKTIIFSNKILVAALFAALPLFGIASVSAHPAAPNMKTLDPDSDGTISLDEAKLAAANKFEMRDPYKDGTLDAKELASPAGHALVKLVQ